MYETHRTNLHKSLTEFERVTGTGNMKLANLRLMEMVKSLVSMIDVMSEKIDSLKTTGGCGGNCKCNTKKTDIPPRVVTLDPPVAASPDVEESFKKLQMQFSPETDLAENAQEKEDTMDEPIVADITVTPLDKASEAFAEKAEVVEHVEIEPEFYQDTVTEGNDAVEKEQSTPVVDDVKEDVTEKKVKRGPGSKKASTTSADVE